MSGLDRDQYKVDAAENGFEIRDDSRRAIVSFADRGSADGLAVLLNQVYRKGYKDGYRNGKKTGQKG